MMTERPIQIAGKTMQQEDMDVAVDQSTRPRLVCVHHVVALVCCDGPADSCEATGVQDDYLGQQRWYDVALSCFSVGIVSTTLTGSIDLHSQGWGVARTAMRVIERWQ
jgi:hypothetical protein